MSDGSDVAYESDDPAYDSDDAAFMDDDEDFSPPPAKGKGKESDYAVNYESLSPDGLQALVDDDIRHVAAIVGAKPPIVSILLRQLRWNRDQLIDRFIEARGETLRSVGAAEDEDEPPPAKRMRMTPSDFACAICLDAAPLEDTFALRCAHRFCAECWRAYATAKIKDEGQCNLACMQEGCVTAVEEPALERLVDASCRARYRELVRASYVAAHPTQLRYCPHPACGETVRCTDGSGAALLTIVPSVRCGERHPFCFGCGMEEWHRPLICKLASTWIRAAREDSGTSQWIKANTRQCPKCQGVIEKGGGCNRMVCRHCSYQFCWMCMKNWDVHGYNNSVCSTWTEPPLDDSMTEAKRNLEKWLFYYDRFTNHELSARLEGELYERTTARIVEMQDLSGISWIEAQFLKDAVDALSGARQTLKWTYAMAHFLATGNEKQMFEDVQADLEKAVEQLSQLIEEPFEADTVKDLRLKCVDKMVYVQKRHDTVLQDTSKHLYEGRWSWSVAVE